jgi:hypothetical protein
MMPKWQHGRCGRARIQSAATLVVHHHTLEPLPVTRSEPDLKAFLIHPDFTKTYKCKEDVYISYYSYN